MRLLLVSGFLGAGKTTLIVELGRALASQGRKAAIIVNEIGEIGLDDQLMRRLGFNVSEILGGCICCTLAGDLPHTLRQLQQAYAPELVLMEPSGAADPAGVLGALADLPRDLVGEVKRLTVLDPLRLEGLWAVLQPLIQSSLENCDLVLINKADAATPAELGFARALARQHHPGVKVFTASAREGLTAPLLAEVLA
ncbi:MAG: cobalamin biosynthesis protein P47K [Deltaproteobacteria bacterium]|nr:cobalamin biosynthesis protein P47K [Deltaproteobacteria bacterium]